MFEEFSVLNFFIIFFGFCAIIITIVLVSSIFLARAKNADSKGYTFHKLTEAYKDNLSRIYVVPENEKLAGLASLKSLPWDEQIFKLKMASVPLLLAKGQYVKKTYHRNKKKIKTRPIHSTLPSPKTPYQTIKEVRNRETGKS